LRQIYREIYAYLVEAPVKVKGNMFAILAAGGILAKRVAERG